MSLNIVLPNILKSVSALELRISEQIRASSTALLAQLHRLTCPHLPTNQQQSISLDATFATGGGKAAQEPHINILNDDSELYEPDFVDLPTYGKLIHAGMERLPPRH
jgi:hypothetical protein